MAALYETDSDSEFEGFDVSDIIPRRIQHEDSDSDIEVSSISGIDSPVTSDDEEENQDQQWTPNFTDFQVSFLSHKNNILFDISLYFKKKNQKTIEDKFCQNFLQNK